MSNFLKYLIDNNIPFEIHPIMVEFEQIGVKDKLDCDILLEMLDKDTEHPETVNAILDYRNTL